MFAPYFFLTHTIQSQAPGVTVPRWCLFAETKKRRCTLVHLLFEELDRESRQLVIYGKQSQQTSVSNGLCAAVHVQFVEDVTCMLLHRTQRDDEFTRDGLI